MNHFDQSEKMDATIQEDEQNYKAKSTNSSGQQSSQHQDSYQSERFKQGRAVRFATEILLSTNPEPGTTAQTNNKPKQKSIRIILKALHELNNRQNTDLSQLLELLVQFDDLEGWRESGSRNCAAWMNQYLHIEMAMGWERLRVGRKLRELPFISSLFSTGRLSWSKVRLLTRIANGENEEQLAHASLDASVSDVIRICESFRWNDTEEDDIIREQVQFSNRGLTWRRLNSGNTVIRLELPPELAQVVLLSIEQCEQAIFEAEKAEAEKTDAEVADNQNETTARQRKADATIMMANRSLTYQREDAPMAERYHVVLNVDASSISGSFSSRPSGHIDSAKYKKQQNDSTHVDSSKVNVKHKNSTQDNASAVNAEQRNSTRIGSHDLTPNQCNASKRTQEDIEKTIAFLAAFDPALEMPAELPLKTPFIEGAGPVSFATARKIMCDCKITTLLTDKGDPINIGSKTRIWPASIRTAIVNRDRHCQFTGCTAHRHLHIHHIVHWADGGETSIENGVCLCEHHHRLIHTGAFDISRADSEHVNGLAKHRELQSIAKKQLLPTRCKFTVRQLRPHQPEYNCHDTKSHKLLQPPTNQDSKIAENGGEYNRGFKQPHSLLSHRPRLGDCPAIATQTRFHLHRNRCTNSWLSFIAN